VTEEVARLRIEVDSIKAKMAADDLKKLEDAGSKTEKATDSLTAAFKRYAGAATIAATATAGLMKLVSVQREFDKINAGLITITGSSAEAAKAFEAIQDFATTTPYSLQQVSEAFIRLANVGLSPSERALASYGNTAAAMGRDLMQFVEAVADASTGEFERLKDFGIKAKMQGDQISFTFQGVTTTVARNSAEIERYLTSLGENQFAGAMAERMKTLDGAISNLSDEWDKMFLNLSQSGVGDSIADGVRVAIDVLSELNSYLASGQFEAHIDALSAAWGPWVDSAIESANIVWDAVSGLFSDIDTSNGSFADTLLRVWTEFPQNVKAFVELATVEFANSLEYWKIEAQSWADTVKAIFTDSTIADAQASYYRAQQARGEAYLSSITAIVDEADASKRATTSALADSEKRRAAFEKEQEARRKANEDRLEGYHKGGAGTETMGSGAAADRKAKADQKRREQEFQQVQESLLTEEEAIQQSYNRRLAIVEANTAAGSAKRLELTGRLEAERNKQLEDYRDSQNRELEQLREFLMTEEESIEASYAKRRAIAAKTSVTPAERAAMLAELDESQRRELEMIDQQRQEKRLRLMEDTLSDQEFLRARMEAEIAEKERGYQNELISFEEFQRAKAEIEQRYTEQTRQLAMANRAQTYDMYAGLFGSLSQLAGTFAQGQGKSAERAFKMQKALAYGQAIMSTAAGVARAFQDHSAPASYVYAGIAAAQGAVQIATISNQKFSGAYDKGGYIPSGSVGIAAEYGDELVNGQLIKGPARVTSRKDTAELMSGGGGGPVVVNINVNLEAGTSETTTDGSGDTAKARELGSMIDMRVRDVLIREKTRPGGLLYGT